MLLVNEVRQCPGCGGDMKHCSDVHKYIWEERDRAPSCVQLHVLRSLLNMASVY